MNKLVHDMEIRRRYGWFFTLILLFFLGGCATTHKQAVQSSYNLLPIAKSTYDLPPGNNDLIGTNYYIKTEKGDSYASIGQRYDVGVQELIDSNPGLNPYRLPIGKKILIPGQYILPPKTLRKGIVINVAEMRLYYFPGNDTVLTFPVALGRDGWGTPLGKTYVFRKEASPTWYVPKSIRQAYFDKTGKEHVKRIGPGSDNPLGDYAIYLHKDGYLIHGNNNPDSIGRLVSSGCVRMYNSDVAELFKYVKRGTPVNIIYYPNKVGIHDGKLLLESHKELAKQYESYADHTITAQQAIADKEEAMYINVNQNQVKRIIKKHRGIPTPIG